MEQTQHGYPQRTVQIEENDPQVWNWAQNAPLGDRNTMRRPGNEAQLQQLIAASPATVKILGSRMSTGTLLRIEQADDTLIDAGQLTGLLAATADTATFAAATPLHEVYRILGAMGRMLPCSPGVIDLQTLAGAIATGTHGQGLGQGALADEVLRIRLIRADGEMMEIKQGDCAFGAAQLALGALGVMTEMTLRTRPIRLYTCQKSASSAQTLSADIYDWNEQFPFSKAWWFPAENQVHVWRAREADSREQTLYRLNQGQPVKHHRTDDTLNATVEHTLRHMENDTKIKEKAGKPYQTVNRFKDFSDVTGDINQLFCRGIATPQINIEIGIPMQRAGQVIEKMQRWHAAANPHMHYPIILRCTGPSGAWLSPAYRQATCFFGFVVYYAEDGTLSPAGVHFINEAEKLLAREGGRPHWGKYFDQHLYHWSELYPQWQNFRRVRKSLDPTGKFANKFIAAIFH